MKRVLRLTFWKFKKPTLGDTIAIDGKTFTLTASNGEWSEDFYILVSPSKILKYFHKLINLFQ